MAVRWKVVESVGVGDAVATGAGDRFHLVVVDEPLQRMRLPSRLTGSLRGEYPKILR